MKALLERLASSPAVYDAIQFAAGRPILDVHLRQWLAHERGLVIDVGGGTGRTKALLPAAARLVCIDIDWRKLSAFHARFPDASAVVADALMLPIRSAAAPLITCIAVSHHLDDRQLERALAEIARIQTPTGAFFFLDAVWIPDRRASRVLWRRDRGAHPRTAQQIREMINRYFRVVEQFEVTVWHRYVACRCMRL
jgi:ubiquinone/menaquinone biosynthesis C-methylase UbiE